MLAWRSLYRRELTRTARCVQARRVSSASVSEETASAEVYCTDLLRQYDAPSYTLLAFVPPSARQAYLAIRAFNVEIARVSDAVSTSHVGALRLQFWKDNISKALDGRPPKHPVPLLIASAQEALAARTQGQTKFSKSWFLRVISAREQYLNDNPYPSIEALESYAESTYSTLLYLTLQALPMASVSADHIASHIGKATGIAAVLRGLPILAFPSAPNHHSNSAGLSADVEQERRRSNQGVVRLPLDVMAEAGLREEDVFRQGAGAPGLRDAVFQVATRANDHLITARTMIQNLRKGQDVGHDFEHGEETEHNHQHRTTTQQLADIERAFGIFMPAVSTGMWLDKLQHADFDIFPEVLRRRDWKLPWKAYWAYQRRSL